MKRIYLSICLTISTSALAMSIRGDASVVAWSKDGSAFLVEKQLHGPEGGGAVIYYFVGTRPQELVAAKLSSDFGDGGGGRPQTVKTPQCRDAAQRLARALGDRFPGVTVSPDRCAERHRDGVVTVEKPLTKGALQVEVTRGKARIVAPPEARRDWILAE